MKLFNRSNFVTEMKKSKYSLERFWFRNRLMKVLHTMYVKKILNNLKFKSNDISIVGFAKIVLKNAFKISKSKNKMAFRFWQNKGQWR